MRAVLGVWSPNPTRTMRKSSGAVNAFYSGFRSAAKMQGVYECDTRSDSADLWEIDSKVQSLHFAFESVEKNARSITEFMVRVR